MPGIFPAKNLVDFHCQFYFSQNDVRNRLILDNHFVQGEKRDRGFRRDREALRGKGMASLLWGGKILLHVTRVPDVHAGLAGPLVGAHLEADDALA